MEIILRIWTGLGLPSEVLAVVLLLLLVFANMYRNKSKEVTSIYFILRNEREGPKIRGYQYLDMHRCLFMPETIRDPLPFLLNILPICPSALPSLFFSDS